MANDTPIRTRQQLYDQIRQTSREEFILSEMIRLGFWAEDEEKPSVAKELIEKEGKLRRELNDLLSTQRKMRNKEAMLKEMRDKRMADAKKRREETKERREKERQERAAAWAEKKTKDISYLGEGVSAGLIKTENDKEKLHINNLPLFEDMPALAEAMGLTIGKLRFLTYTRKTSKTNHYKRFFLPKKSGGQRMISAPMPYLKAAQYWILENILYKLEINEHAHGFVPERSIKSNAEKHIGKDVVINLDLKDFFPSVSYKRVKGMFKSLGYSEQIATIFGLLCTEPEVDEVEMDRQKYYVSKGSRFLPQGAPTSPAITNIICYKMDRRFEGVANKLGFTYTRYADDLTFSASGNSVEKVSRILWQVKEIVEDEGFKLHPKKIRVMRNGRRKEVTGIVVNEKMNVDRKTLRKFRALLYQIEKNGIEGKKWGDGHLLNTIQGYAQHVYDINPEKGKPYLEKVKALLADPAISALRPKRISKSQMRKEAAAVKERAAAASDNAIAESPGQNQQPWWKVW